MTEKQKPVANSFSGKCIHGKDGARFVMGHLVTPSCTACQAMIHERKSRG